MHARSKVVFYCLSVMFLVLSVCITTAQAVPVYFSETGHSYDFISGSFTWDQARLAAEAQSYNGVSGYLATLTSAAEDQFIRTAFPNQVGQFVGPWFGADWDGLATGPTGGWHWVTGETFSYTGWNGGEPNHLSGEDAIHFSRGGWNDIGRSRTDAIGYLVEFNTGSVPVPEPATLLLLVFGLLGLMAGKKKLKN